MKNGNRKARSDGRAVIKVFLSDVYGTLVGLEGMTSDQLSLNIASEVLGQRLSIDPVKFGRAVSRLRLDMAKKRDLPLQSQSGPEGWARINVRALALFGYPCTLSQGRRISHRFTETLETMKVKTGMRAFLHDLIVSGLGGNKVGRGWKAYVASNSTENRVLLTLRTRVLARYFIGIFTPDNLGGARKPDPEFYLAICRKLGIRPEEAVMMGSSLFNDLAAAAAGLWVIWLEDSGKPDIIDTAAELFGKDVWKRIFICNSLEQARDVVKGVFRNP